MSAADAFEVREAARKAAEKIQEHFDPSKDLRDRSIHEVADCMAKLSEEFHTKFAEAMAKRCLGAWARGMVVPPSLGRGLEITLPVLPEDAVRNVVAFVGETVALNPMTAELARAMSDVQISWMRFENEAYLQKMRADLRSWWAVEGGDLVATHLKSRASNPGVPCKVQLGTVPRAAILEVAKCIRRKRHILKGEETNVLQHLAAAFTDPPLVFSVQLSLKYLRWNSRRRSFDTCEDEVDLPNTTSDRALELCNDTSLQRDLRFFVVLDWA